jgi:hypothetical protein
MSEQTQPESEQPSNPATETEQPSNPAPEGEPTTPTEAPAEGEPTGGEPEGEPTEEGTQGVDYDGSQDEIQAQKAESHEADKERLAAESE